MSADKVKATEGPAGPAPVDTTTGEVAGGVWEVPARFVGFQAPRAWSMPDDRNPGQIRSGSTYRVDVRVPEGTVLMKIPEQVYQDMQSAALDFGDRISILYGRAVINGELRVTVAGFRRV